MAEGYGILLTKIRKMKKLLKALFLISALIQSCAVDDPKEYFSKVALSINRYTEMGKGDFEQMKELKSVNALYANLDGTLVPTDRYEAHIKYFLIPEIDKELAKLNRLKGTKETAEMIAASIDVFEFIKSGYEGEYLVIAKLMDDGESQEIINSCIQQFEDQNIATLHRKINDMLDIAIPYAEKNGLIVTRY